jgi:hypothetical protein
LITGDIHASNSANLLQNNLSTNFKVTSFVKPNANMKVITNTANEELNPLQSDDLVVVWAGANDIGKNNLKEAMNSVSEFVETNKDLNVILINSPHRYDLSPESCVNNEVAKFNRQVKKVMKLQPKVRILELTLDRYHFTSHGLHLNFKGKKVVSQNLALVVQQFFSKENIPPNPIPVLWKDPPLDDTIIEIQDTNATEKVKNQTLPPYQRRNCPARRNPDFFMDAKDGFLQNTEQRKVKESPFKVYHQNNRSLRSKSHELLCHIFPNLPHIIWLTEHRMNTCSCINIEGYTTGAQYCRVLHEKRGVII